MVNKGKITPSHPPRLLPLHLTLNTQYSRYFRKNNLIKKQTKLPFNNLYFYRWIYTSKVIFLPILN